MTWRHITLQIRKFDCPSIKRVYIFPSRSLLLASFSKGLFYVGNNFLIKFFVYCLLCIHVYIIPFDSNYN